MSAQYDDAASRLWWALRRYAWLVLSVILAVVGLAFAVAPDALRVPPTYRASAIVIATQLEIRADQLPRLTETVFTGGTVAETAVAEGQLPIDPEDLIPEYAELNPIEDNVVVRVEGRSEDPELAAAIANSVAEALTVELNKAGQGVGTFAVQDRARVPDAPEPQPPLPLPLVASLVAGPMLGLGLVALVLVVRQPILGPDEVERLSGLRVLGAPTLPRGRRLPDPLRVAGLLALVKSLFPERRESVVLFCCKGSKRARSRLALVLVRALARRDPVAFLPAGEPRLAGLSDREGTRIKVISSRQALRDRDPHVPLVLEGPSAAGIDLPQFIPPDATAVLVVRQGTSRSALLSAAQQFLEGELAGAVYVSFRGGLRPTRRTAVPSVPELADLPRARADEGTADLVEPSQPEERYPAG